MNTLSKTETYAPYHIHIDTNCFPRIFEPQYCFTELCKNSNQKLAEGSIESGHGSHYDEDAHKWFANRLYNYISRVLL